MDKLKQYVVFTVVGSMAVLAAGWFLLVSPKRSEAADLRSQAVSQVSANAQLETQLQVLKAQARDLPKQQARLAAVAAKIPDNPALPAMIRALTTAATSAGVELVTVLPATPAVVAAAPVAAAPQAAGTTARATSATGAGELSQIPLTITVVGGYFPVQQFVANLEALPRSLRVQNLVVAPGLNPVKPAAGQTVDDGKSLLATITGQVFMATNRAPATAATVPTQGVAGTGAGSTTPVTPAIR
jgi:type IV pilus assembly protein PilO